jgi:hypothetical protein
MNYDGIMQYDKIYDIVMHLGMNCVLKFNVSLSSQGKDNNRQFAYSEYEYHSNKYGCNLVTVKIDADYYLSIENVVAMNGYQKAFIRIGLVEIVKLKSALEVCYEWFHDSSYSGLFIKSNGRLMLGHVANPFIIDNLPMGKYLKFEPCVVERINTGDLFPGISIELGEPGNTVELDINLFHAFREVISNFNMYLAYSMMMSSLVSRADFTAINRYDVNSGFRNFNSENRQIPSPPKINNTTGQSGVNGRKLMTINKSKSIDDL